MTTRQDRDLVFFAAGARASEFFPPSPSKQGEMLTVFRILRFAMECPLGSTNAEIKVKARAVQDAVEALEDMMCGVKLTTMLSEVAYAQYYDDLYYSHRED